MIEKNFYGIDFAEIDSVEPTKAIQILKIGEFDHPSAGKIKITKEDLTKFVASFRNGARKIDLAINYEHFLSNAHGTKAAGWIKELQVRGDGSELWAEPEWTPDGLRQVKDKEYRYLSVEFLWLYKDNETGVVHERVLKGAALTNYPVIKGMSPIEASEINQDKNINGGIEMNLSEIKIKLSELGVDFAEIERKAKGFDELSISLSELTKERDTLKGEVAKAVQKAQESQKKIDELKFSELVNKGMTEGRLTKVMAEGIFKTLFEKNGAEFAESFLAEMPVVVDVKQTVGGHASDAVNNSDASDIQKKVSDMATEIMSKESVSFSEACHRVFKQNEALAKSWLDLAE
jgi:phage I-like protein